MDVLIPLATDIAARLIARKETVAVSESSAGGLISAALLAVPGASAYYRGGGVIYTGAAFKGLMGLSRDDVAGMRSSTEPYAALLAGTVRERLRASWGLSETGAAGPDCNGYGDPAGHACFALVGADGAAMTTTLATGLSDRAANMERFAKGALEHFLKGLDRG
ncbi:MAG: CinA family protein [Pseudomonadota bacterium]